MKKALLIILGVIITVVGLGAAVTGGAIWTVFGTTGSYSVALAPAASTGAAIYVNAFDVQQQVIPRGLLDVAVEAKTRNGKDVFIGVGPPDKVQNYLAGVPYDAASQIVDGTFALSPVPGQTLPAPPPGSQSFWTEAAQGPQPALDWAGQDGTQVLVVMNADGSAGVDADTAATLSSPSLFPAALALLVVGVLLVVLGIWLIVRGARSRRRAG